MVFDLMDEQINANNERINSKIGNPANQLIKLVLLLLEWYHLYIMCIFTTYYFTLLALFTNYYILCSNAYKCNVIVFTGSPSLENL